MPVFQPWMVPEVNQGFWAALARGEDPRRLDVGRRRPVRNIRTKSNAKVSQAPNPALLRETLAAWLAASLRAEDAATALGVSTRTVLNRLATAGKSLGRHPRELATELDVALRIRTSDHAPPTQRSVNPRRTR